MFLIFFFMIDAVIVENHSDDWLLNVNRVIPYSLFNNIFVLFIRWGVINCAFSKDYKFLKTCISCFIV